ncbi:MAG TPA: hypothetical protein PLH72_12215 [Vicinamibacterales bacterium]|nr:hypothetical protein [Vicinamibacterales bacterium]
MTPFREAIVLPATCLSVVLLGGIRLDAAVSIEPPTLFSLVLATLALGVFVQTGTLDPSRLLHSERASLANLNGALAVATAFLATAQVLSLLTPAAGLPSVAVGLFFLIAILQFLAASLDRARFLRGWAVTLLSAFVLKFVVLSALSGPADRPVARALQVLFEGLTLGALSQPAAAPAAGYLAFLTLALYLVALVLLPASQRRALVLRQ